MWYIVVMCYDDYGLYYDGTYVIQANSEEEARTIGKSKVGEYVIPEVVACFGPFESCPVGDW